MSTETEREPEMLDERELRYHGYVLARVGQLPVLEAEIRKIQGARDLWADYLSEQHGLRPEDRVLADGQIIRANGTGG